MNFKALFAVIITSFSFPCQAVEPVKELSLEEKVGQLLMVHFNGECANDDAKALIQECFVGGIMYYNWANSLSSPEQVLNLSAGLQSLAQQNRSAIPLFIAVDQEGGIVARLTKGFTIFPGNKALGMTGNAELSERASFAIGQELKAVGVNFNLSPVVDVNSNPRNPVIGIRSFGDNPTTVISFATKSLLGYHRAGIITSLKHFPGHGDVAVDSHQDLPIILKSRKQLDAMELLPFSELVPHADTIMTAHVVVPSIDPVNCVTLSKDALDILRNEIGFQGVIISDSLVMEGLLKNCVSIDEGCIQALNAGCDILMLGGKQLVGAHENLELTVADVKRIHQTLVEAVKNGRVSEQCLDSAVQRILNLKNLYDFTVVKNPNVARLVNTVENQLLAQKIASLALTVIKNTDTSIGSLESLNVTVLAPELVQDTINQTSLLHLGSKNSSLFFHGLNPDENEIQKALALAESADVLILCSYNAWKNNSQVALYHTLLSSKKPIILISLRDPLDTSLFPDADLSLTTFSPTAPSIEAACEYLKNKTHGN